MDPKEYKTFHENHMKHNTGTSTEECACLISSASLLSGIASWTTPHLPKSVVPVAEFFLIILPVTFESTVLSDVDHLVYVNLLLLLLIIAIFKVDFKTVCNKLNSRFEGRSSITSYRSITNFYSALCILAVDFTVFPKRLAKTESFGFGFMDLGVGFYVCSNALVEKHSPTKNEFVKLLKSVSVLLVLGGIRLLSVKSLDYHEHVSEYGVHWNFFFTLASCRLISYYMKTCTNLVGNPIWLALATGLTHQMLLAGGLQEWVLSDVPRDSLLSANREGLTSSLGYVSLYFTASSLGKLLHNSDNLPYKKVLQRLVVLILINYATLIILLKTIGVSRRLVNLGYIIWVLLLTVVQLTVIIIKELLISGVTRGKNPPSSDQLPVLIECINANALFFFLFANVLTGLVNTLFQTLLLEETWSMAIIICYMAVLYVVNYFLYINNIRLKL